MDPNTGYSGYPVPSPQNQQMAFYPPNQVPQYPQSKPPSTQSFMPMQSAPGGAMIPPGFPQSSTAAMDNFAAPYPQAPIPASMGQYIPQVTSNANMPSQVAQTFSQNMASISANNLLGAQSKPSSQMNSPQSGASPAAPAPAPAQAPVQVKPQSQSPSQPQVQSQAQAQVQAQLAALEKDRVAWLLEINSTLLQKVVDLQAAGTAGPGSTPDGNTPASEQTDGSKVNQKSTLYIDCMRRLQANLAYLATIADRSKKVGGVAPQGPAIMTPPPNLPDVDELYAKLVDSVNKSTPQKPSPNGGPSP